MSTVKLISKSGKTITLDGTAMTAERTTTFPDHDTDLREYVPGSALVLTGFGEWTGSGAYWSYARPTFTLLRGGYGYIRGSKITFGAGLTVDVTLNAANYIYINASAQLLAAPNTNALYTDQIALFELIDDGVNGIFVKKENHGVNFNATISSYIHNNIGNVVRGAGAIITRMSTLTPPTGATQVQTQYKIVGEDAIEDHGLETTIPDSAGVAIAADYWYLNTAAGPTKDKWIRYSNGDVPPLYYAPPGNAPAPLSTSNRGIIKIYVTQDDLNAPTPRYIGVLHNAQFPSLAEANVVISNGTAASPTNELLAMELVQLGYIVVRNTGTYGYIEQVTIQRATANARYIGGTAGSSHLTLSDLNAGQYADAGHTGLVTRFVSTVPPTINDDIDTYKTGSIWLDSATRRCYINTSNVDGAAIWPKIAYSTDTAFGVNTTAASGAVAIGDGLTASANTVRIGASGVTNNYLFGSIRLTRKTTGSDITVDSYGDISSLGLRRSMSTTVMQQTTDLAVLGQMIGSGVTSANTFARGASVAFIQTGAATATAAVSDIVFKTSDGTADTGTTSATHLIERMRVTATGADVVGSINGSTGITTNSVLVKGAVGVDGSIVNSAGIGWVGGQGAMALKLNRGLGSGGFYFQQYTNLGVVEDETTINKAVFTMKKYSTTATTTSAITLARSRNDTFGTNTATASQDYLGAIIGAGVNATPAAYRGAAIVFRQEGAADATGFLSNILFQTADKSADSGTMSSPHLVTRVIVGSTGTLYAQFGCTVTGNFVASGGTKTFMIPHPDPAKTKTHKLVHACIEGPTRGDTLYRYTVQIKVDKKSQRGTATINLPSYFKFLNEDVQVWVTPMDCFGRCYGTIDEKYAELTVFGDVSGQYNVLVMGTRKDPDAVRGFEELGGVESENRPNV